MFKKPKIESQVGDDYFTKKNPLADLSTQDKIVSGISVALVIIAILLGFHHNGLSKDASQYDLALNMAQNRNAELTQKSANKVISTPNGQLDEVASNNINQLTTLFNQLTTFKSATDYQNNINTAKQTVTDQSFFSSNGFLPVLDNSDPNKSSIATQSIKSATDSVRTYEVSSTQFIVMVSQFYYHNDKVLQYRDKLSSTSNTLLISMNGGKITKVTNLNTPHLTN